MIIHYILDKKDINRRIRTISKSFFGHLCILDPLCLALGTYLSFFGFTYQNNDSKINGISLLCIVIIHVLTIPFHVRNLKNKLEQSFNEFSKDGLMHYTFSCENERYVVKCLESGKETFFAKSDIKKITSNNDIIIIFLKTKFPTPTKFIDMPYNDMVYNELVNK